MRDRHPERSPGHPGRSDGSAFQDPIATFLDPTVLARIGNLELLARTVVEGFIGGLHRSPRLGASTDFAEHRPYSSGDDIRRIDWKLYARTDRYHVKEFEADTNTNLLVLLDVSPSMHYRGDGVSKLEYGSFLAASLAYFSSGQRDRVGLATFDRDLVDYVPCAARHLRLVLHALDRANRAASASGRSSAPEALGTTHGAAGNLRSSLSVPLQRLAEQTRRRSIVVLISDLYEEPDAVLSALAHVRGRGNELIVFHPLDRDELEFPFTDAANFLDIESGERMPLVPDYLRAEYRAVVRRHTETLARRSREQQVDYTLLDTSRPLDAALFGYLAARQRRGTART
ncbi:MAG: DUF58 domain-containing protein [Gemmatimonadetes bacterium]|nr:DUF58 domain-containing protein [Gemmatimonadota bacterium]